MKKRGWMILAAAFVLLLAGALFLYDRLGETIPEERLVSAQTTQGTEQSGAADTTQGSQHISAPDFTVYDAEGKAVHLTDFAGKPIILNFWASWCGPCQMEMPDFQEAFEELGDDIQFLMINSTDGSRETVQTALDFIKKQGYTFPVFFDSSYDASYAYSAYSLPTTYFIDADGNVIAHATGMIDAQTLQQGISLIYSE